MAHVTTHRIARHSIEVGMKISLPEYHGNEDGTFRPLFITVDSVEHSDSTTRVVSRGSHVIYWIAPGMPVEVVPQPGEIWA